VTASGMMIILVDSERITNTLGRSSDLSGRTEIWSLVVSNILNRPILGYGYSAFWGAAPESEIIDRTMGTPILYSHNGYLEIFLTMGAVGLLLTLGFLGSGIKRAYYWSERDSSSVGLWPLAFLFFFLLHNLAECTILLQDLEWALCVAAVAATDPALLGFGVEQEQQEEELLFAPGEEFT
jgi:O-antigen ligase